MDERAKTIALIAGRLVAAEWGVASAIKTATDIVDQAMDTVSQAVWGK